MNKCSILIKRGKGKQGCPNEAIVWLQMDKLGNIAEQDTPCIWLCKRHADKVRNWGFK